MRSVLVSGANGFVGTALCQSLLEKGYAVTRAVRQATTPAGHGMVDTIVGGIGPQTQWAQALQGVEALVHLAARTHVMEERAADALDAYRLINVAGTQALARAAATAGVRRFIFLSSIKVNAESTGGHPCVETDAPRPQDAYGISKWEAEQALWKCASESRMECVVLRAPLLYGPGVKGNFLRLMRAIDRSTPLPLASIKNRRSLLYVGNLVDAIILSLEHPRATGNTYLVADDLGVSTPALIRAIAGALDRPARLLPCPAALLDFAGRISGKSSAVSRLISSLEIDSGKIRRELGWTPRTGLAAGLKQTAQWYYQQHRDGRSA